MMARSAMSRRRRASPLGHAADCTCSLHSTRSRFGRWALAAAMFVAGLAAGLAIITIADRATGGLGVGVMAGHEGKSS